jgi:hypothetical protein
VGIALARQIAERRKVCRSARALALVGALQDLSLPSDLKDLYLAERALDSIRSDEEPTIPLEGVMKRHDVKG